MSESETQRWLRYAKEDMHAAERMVQDRSAVPRLACWVAQQAAEKALKAALIGAGTGFPKTHDLDALQALLPGNWPVKRPPFNLSRLSEWAVEARYPGNWPDAGVQDAKDAVELAARLVRAIEGELERRGLI